MYVENGQGTLLLIFGLGVKVYLAAEVEGRAAPRRDRWRPGPRSRRGAACVSEEERKAVDVHQDELLHGAAGEREQAFHVHWENVPPKEV